MIQCIANGNEGLFILDAPGGTDKTFLINFTKLSFGMNTQWYIKIIFEETTNRWEAL